MLNRKEKKSAEQIQLNMTPMIDVVFNLLIFFVMTFKIVAPEGDFSVKMPQVAQASTPDINTPFEPVIVKLDSNANGDLTRISCGGSDLGRNMSSLRTKVLQLIGGDLSAAEAMEVELDCDPRLRYEYTITAITMVSGYINEQGEPVPMISNVKFARKRY